MRGGAAPVSSGGSDPLRGDLGDVGNQVVALRLTSDGRIKDHFAKSKAIMMSGW